MRWRSVVPWSMLLAVSAASVASGQNRPEPAWDDTDEEIVVPAEFAAYSADSAEPGDVQFASLLQQPGGQPGAAATPPAPRRYATGGRQAGNRLASVPHMFGDCGMTTGTVTIVGNGAITNAQFMLPVVGGSRTGKISENDVALPVDRVFFNYNHYANIFTMQEEVVTIFPPGSTLLTRAEPIDRYTLGAEKTFMDGWMSVELRMPFNGAFDANLQSTGVSLGNVGNLAVLLKSLLYRGDNLGVGGGLAIDTPTGSSTRARLGATNLQFLNEAVHLLPYLGFLYAPGDPQWGWGNGLFMTGFVQVDVATSGNTVRFVDPNGGATQSLGKYNDQTLLFADLGLGYWLYRDSDAPRWTGLAVVGEAHYTTSLQNTDLVADSVNGTSAVVTNTSNRFDVVNGTIAVQALMFDASSLRVGGVFPMGRSDDKRFFDGELQVQFNRRF